MGETAGDSTRVIADRYEVVRLLGQGSSARTLLCLDRQQDRQVAIKELHVQHLEDWKYLELFEREAQLMSRLDHPGIPEVFEFFQSEQGATSLYIVQEFIAGSSLKQRMESGPMLGQEEVHDFTLGLLDVLEYLHGRAPPVLHRDIKPSNVLIRASGDPVLVDFGGVCYAWRPPGVAGTTVVGTSGYMPPEQFVGQSGPASDLYSLGATLLHLVTGIPPSDFPFDSGRIEVPANLPAGPALRRLIDALLRPAPRDRPQSAAEARRILANQTPLQSSVGNAVAVRSTRTDRQITVVSGDGPRFVDMAPPPRDPRGEFKDVYRNLINPLYPARLLWSPAMHVFWLAISGVLTMASFGVAPIMYISTIRSRRRSYEDLFRDGQGTRGIILSAQKRELLARFKYEFEIDGMTYVAFMEYAAEMMHFWGEGDVVPVLYDPADPRRSCFVYR